jgi:hypothetical protein
MSDELETLTEGTEWRSLLNIAEQRAVESAIRGEALDFAGDSHSDIRRARDPLPVIRARVIEVLALGLRADWPVHRRGIRIGGARVEGQLDLADGEVMTPLALTSCLFDHSVSMTATRLPELDLRGSHLPSLTAERMKVAGSVYLGDEFTTTGTVELQAAVIGKRVGLRSCSSGI